MKQYLAVAFALLLGLSFAWVAGYSPPSCIESNSLLGVNFSVTTNNTNYNCINYPIWAALTTRNATTGNISSGYCNRLNDANGSTTNCTSTAISNSGTTNKWLNLTVSNNLPADNTVSMNITANFTLEFPCSETITNYTATVNRVAYTGNWFTEVQIVKIDAKYGDYWSNFSYSGTGALSVASSMEIKVSCNSSDGIRHINVNGTEFTTTAQNLTVYLNGSLRASSGAGTTTRYGLNVVTTLITANGTYYENDAINTNIYKGINGNTLTYSDFTTGRTVANNSLYCQLLLYFNNPYYGNIQLIPKLTYVPGIEAYTNFYNSSSYVAYIKNNTLVYVYDSVTETWYIVPAYVCGNYSVIGSTSTLQYNPTGISGSPGGTLPIEVNQITGSCSYATATRLITCSGTDSSGTITTLGLSAYLTGNITDLCGSTGAGPTATLTCTLPAQNGTYQAYFYGIDTNTLQHTFAYKEITIGYDAPVYGREAFLIALILFGALAMFVTSSIAISMVLGCFGLFAALAFGILPMSNLPVVVLFTVVAFVIIYRLKV